MAKNNKPAAAEKESDWDEENPLSEGISAAAPQQQQQNPPTAATSQPSQNAPTATVNTNPNANAQVTQSGASATSGTQPDVQQQQNQQPQREPLFELPEGLKESFALLSEMEHTPARGKNEERAKARAMARVRRHIHALQQGTPRVTINANDHADASKRHREVTRESRWKYLARENRVAAEMLSEIEQLRTRLEQLNNPKK